MFQIQVEQFVAIVIIVIPHRNTIITTGEGLVRLDYRVKEW